MSLKKKRKYVLPKIQSQFLVFEESIAVGSVKVLSTQEQDGINLEWENVEKSDVNINW